MKLKRCPFCGGEASIDVGVGYTGHILYKPYCTDPDCVCSLVAERTRELAVNKWNERVDLK